MRISGLREQSANTWVTVDDDPQITVSFKFIRPRFTAIFLDALGEAVDPVVYVDKGTGFSEGDCIALQYSGPTLFVIPTAEWQGIRRLRFDPATACDVSLRLWIKNIYGGERKLVALVERLAKEAMAIGSLPPKCVRISSPGSFKSTQDRTARSVAEHFQHVVALAAQAPPLRAGDAFSAIERGTPSFSFLVPTYNTSQTYLDDVVRSFLSQGACDAELVLSDDGSTSRETIDGLERWRKEAGVKVIRSSVNTGIASTLNRGLSVAKGDWIGFIDHDDALAPYALQQVEAATMRHPEAMLIYTDEVLTDERLSPVGYLLKPAYDPVLLSGVNYLNHLSLYRRTRLLEIGGLREGMDGSQDYDLVLRYTESVSPDQIVHVPFPAYVWRRGPSAFSIKFLDRAVENARKALRARYAQSFPAISIGPALDNSLHRVRFDLALKNWPRISVIIPNLNAYPLISTILRDLHDKTDYPDLEIVVVDNGSTDPRVLALYEHYSKEERNFKVIESPGKFNFSRQVNRGIAAARGEHVLLLNNDIEVLAPDWLREMVSCLCYDNVGIVGAKLLYPNGTIQHAGVIVGFGGLAGHWYDRKPKDVPGPFARLRVRQTLSAVTGACMLISRGCLDRVGQFDEARFGVAYNDVDYCLRASLYGLRTVWTPFATLVHLESASRGSDEVPKNRERFAQEKSALRKRHGTDAFVDPYFNPWYTLNRSEPGLALLGELPKSRNGASSGAPLRTPKSEAS